MMEHKAFLFDGDRFDEELRPTIEAALSTGDCVPLVDFICDDLDVLTDPYEGEPLPPDWDSMLETKDAHDYGDFALTKYYDPTADIGLGASWERLQELVASDPDIVTSRIPGATIGPADSPFDPGKMGAYFQSASQVAANYRGLLDLARESSSDVAADAVRMLGQAVRAGKGLYITF
jgi:hypothetical protein